MNVSAKKDRSKRMRSKEARHPRQPKASTPRSAAAGGSTATPGDIYVDELEGMRVRFPHSPVHVQAELALHWTEDWKNGRDVLSVYLTPAQAKALGLMFVRVDRDDAGELKAAGYEVPKPAESAVPPAPNPSSEFLVPTVIQRGDELISGLGVAVRPGMIASDLDTATMGVVIEASRFGCTLRTPSGDTITTGYGNICLEPAQELPDAAARHASGEAAAQPRLHPAFGPGLRVLYTDPEDSIVPVTIAEAHPTHAVVKASAAFADTLPEDGVVGWDRVHVPAISVLAPGLEATPAIPAPSPFVAIDAAAVDAMRRDPFHEAELRVLDVMALVDQLQVELDDSDADQIAAVNGLRDVAMRLADISNNRTLAIAQGVLKPGGAGGEQR